MPELIWVLSNDLSNVSYPLPKDLDQVTLDTFLQRDYSKDPQQQKIIDVFQTLFTHKTLLNLPSDIQENKQKMQRQWDSQVGKLKNDLLRKMKVKKQKYIGNIRAFEFNYKEFTRLMSELIVGIQQWKKFDLEKVFEQVVEGECRDTFQEARDIYAQALQTLIL